MPMNMAFGLEDAPQRQRSLLDQDRGPGIIHGLPVTLAEWRHERCFHPPACVAKKSLPLAAPGRAHSLCESQTKQFAHSLTGINECAFRRARAGRGMNFGGVLFGDRAV